MAYRSSPSSVCGSYLIDGFISATFGPRDAERYMAMVLKVNPRTVVAALDNGAFYVFNPPSRYTPPTCVINRKWAWLFDYSISYRAIGTVVPQRLYRNFVDNIQYRVPAFFVNRNGSLGVPISNAGHIQLRDGHLAQSLSHKPMLTIRLVVRTHFL